MKSMFYCCVINLVFHYPDAMKFSSKAFPDKTPSVDGFHWSLSVSSLSIRAIGHDNQLFISMSNHLFSSKSNRVFK